jgi:hypothetical protein
MSIAWFSETLADHIQQSYEIAADKKECGDCGDDDKGENKCVLRETLSFLAVKDEEHDASFLGRRLVAVTALAANITASAHAFPTSGPA